MTTPILGLTEAVSNQYNLDVTFNEAFRRLEATTVRALSATTTAQPASPADGDVYLITSTPTGATWASYPVNTIAYYRSDAWVAYYPRTGMNLFVVDTAKLYYFNGTAWEIMQITFDPSHNTLEDLQGGATDEYFHITSAEHTVLQDIVENGAGLSYSYLEVSTNTTAEADSFYSINTTAGAVSLTLPLAPVVGETFVRLVDAKGTFATNNLTILRNGQKIMGLDEDLVIDHNDLAMELLYLNTTEGWVIHSVSAGIGFTPDALTSHLTATDPHLIASSTLTLTNKTLTDYTNRIHADALHRRVKNSSGAIINAGQPVAFSGYNSGEDAVEVVLANSATSVAIGLAEESIGIGSFGMITLAGILEGIDTSSYTVGQILYVNGAGSLTATQPTVGYQQPIAFVLSAKNNGAIQVLAAYPKQDAADVRYSGATTVYDALSGHIANTSNPHSVTAAQAGAVPITAVGAADGVASLDSTTKVPKAQLGTGTADNTKFLRGDGTWSVPADLGAGIGSLTFFKADGTQDDIDLVAATSLTTLEVTGEFNMTSAADFRIGTGFGWRDMMGPIEARGSAAPSWTLFRNGIYGYAFASNQTKEAFVNFHIDHDYAVGTNLYPHIHFSSKTTSSGVVRFGIEWTMAKGHQQASGSLFGATTTVYVEATINGGTDQYKHFVAEVSDADAIPSTNAEVDGMILLRIFRDTASANDTFPDDIFVWQSDLHYQTAKFATKNKAPDFYA